MLNMNLNIFLYTVILLITVIYNFLFSHHFKNIHLQSLLKNKNNNINIYY